MRDLNDLVDAASRQRYGEVGLPVSINNAGQIGLRAYGQGAILTPFVLGDMNCDEAVDAFDIEAFVTGLVDPPAYHAAYPGCFRKSAGDINQDGEFDAFDIEAFIEVLSGP